MEEHEGLGDNVTPKNYRISFEPNFNSFKTYGEEEISVLIREYTNVIRLNSKEIEITQANVETNGRLINAIVKESKDQEEIEIALPEKINGEAKIKISFVTENNDRMYGFYRSKYSIDGKEEYMLTTDFEPANARAAFPCMDEPALKASFDIKIRISKELEGISNMPVKEELIDGNRKLISFETTPIMSTYLLYLGIGKFERISDKLGNVLINVLTAPRKGKFAKTALDYAKRFVNYFNEYFGIQYPLPKIDLIAIPDFPVGAMENWGAITFRESRLLIDDKSSSADKMHVAETIAHELAHQWFGDLVTMRWWNDLWLNESFATLMSYKAMEKVFPKWRTDLEYLIYAFGGAFVTDGLKATHPISVHVNSVAEIEEIFDDISYRKGGSVLRMLDYYAGMENFRRGLNIYLNKHAYSNATKSDLWNAIEAATIEAGNALPIEEIMNAWLNKPGYPILNVYSDENGFRLTQKRFLFSGQTNDLWPIPIDYVSSLKNDSKSQKERSLLMKTATGTIRSKYLGKLGTSDWIKLNYGQHGFYRVSYDENLLKRIGALIKSKKLPVEDAWGIENDLFALVRASVIKTEHYLDFISDFCAEPEYPLSDSVLSHLEYLYIINYENPLNKRVAEVSSNIARTLLRRLGWNKKSADSQTDKLTRASAINVLGAISDAATTEKAQSLFNEYENKGKPVPTDILPAVYSIVALNGDEKTFESLVREYEKTTSPTEIIAILSALGKFRNETLLVKALDFSKSDKLRLQDSWIVAAAATYNPISQRILWQWTRNNWTFLSKRYAPGTKILHKYVESLSIVKDRASLEQIEKFFSIKENFRSEFKNYLKQTLEKINLNIKYLRRAGFV